MRERGLNRRRGTERGWREREESPERGEKSVRSDTDTDVESTQSRQKKGQMKSIFLSDSDEEAIVEFVKQHEELYDKTNDSFNDKQKKERLWEQLAATRNLPVNTVKKCCAAYTDSHRRACYSDCQSTATTKAFISVSTANFLHSCG